MIIRQVTSDYMELLASDFNVLVEIVVSQFLSSCAQTGTLFFLIDVDV